MRSSPVRLYLHFILTMFLEEGQTKSFGINLLLHAGFHVLLQHSASVIRPHVIQDRKILSMGADVPSVGPVE